MVSFKNNLFVLPDLDSRDKLHETGSCNVQAKLGPDFPLPT